MDQLRQDGRIGHGGELGTVCAVEQYDGILNKVWDDITGVELDPKLVEQARQEEIKTFKDMGVYVKAPIKECWDKTGKAPIGVRWIDINLSLIHI